MIFELDNTLTEIPDFQRYDISTDLNELVNDTDKYFSITDIPEFKLKNSGLVGLLSKAYNCHNSVILNPHDIWIMITSELARHVNLNPEKFRSIFTDSDDKKEIIVMSVSLTEMPMDLLVGKLRDEVLFDASMLLPKFTTNTKMINEFQLAIFCDMSSPYYNYSMYRCGIKSIKLAGIIDDWLLIRTELGNINKTFSKCDESLTEYFTRANDIIDSLIKSIVTGNVDYIKSIFTKNNHGSGQPAINGWIKNLYINTFRQNLQDYNTNHAIVKYKQLDTGDEFKAIYGGFDYNVVNGFLELHYEKFIFQKEIV